MKGRASATLVTLAVTLIWLTGCATTTNVVKAKDDGTAKTYRVGHAQAWEIAKTVLRWQGSDSIEEHQSDRYLLARDGKEWMPWGTLMVAWVDPIDKKRTKVTVVTKRRAGKGVATSSSDAAFHEDFARAVAMVKAGKSLPAEPPK